MNELYDGAVGLIGALAATLVVFPLQVLVLLLLGRPVGYRLNRIDLGSGPVLFDRVSALWLTLRLVPLGYRYSGGAVSRSGARRVARRMAVLALLPILAGTAVLLVPVPPAAQLSFMVVLLVMCVVDARTRWVRSALAPTSVDGRTDPASWRVINRAAADPGETSDSELAAHLAAHPDDVPVLRAAVLRAWEVGDREAALRYEGALEDIDTDDWWLANTRLATLCLAVERGQAPAGWEQTAVAYESKLDARQLDPAVLDTLALSRVLRGDVVGADERIERAFTMVGGAGIDANGVAHLCATRALVRVAQGRPAEADLDLERAIRASPDDPRWGATQRCISALAAGRSAPCPDSIPGGKPEP